MLVSTQGRESGDHGINGRVLSENAEAGLHLPGHSERHELRDWQVVRRRAETVPEVDLNHGAVGGVEEEVVQVAVTDAEDVARSGRTGVGRSEVLPHLVPTCAGGRSIGNCVAKEELVGYFILNEIDESLSEGNLLLLILVIVAVAAAAALLVVALLVVAGVVSGSDVFQSCRFPKIEIPSSVVNVASRNWILQKLCRHLSACFLESRDLLLLLLLDRSNFVCLDFLVNVVSGKF